MKILLVEDDAEKARLVCNALLEVSGINFSDIHRCSSVFETKAALSERHFDLMILDMNLPGRIDRTTQITGGLEVSRFLDGPGKYNYPANVVALTAYAEAASHANSGFSNPLWKVIHYASDESNWRDTLKAVVATLLRHSKPTATMNDGATYHVDLGIIVGLEEVELKSILALDPNASMVVVPHDPIQYYKGQFKRGTKEVHFVAAAPPNMGLVHTAVVATKLIRSFRPRFVAMSGICAGVRSRTNFGDILVADPCFDWGSGKVVSSVDNEEDFLTAPYQWRLDADLRSAAKALSDDKIWLDALYKDWPSSRPENETKIRINALASGGSVLQRKESVNSIIKRHKNLVGIEMEAYSVFTAAELADNPRPKAIVAKSVCDFGDEHKSDNFQQFAAYTSAKFIEEIALRLMSKET